MESDRKPLLLSFFCCLSLSLNYSNKKPVGRHFVRFFSGGKSLATEEVSDVASRSIGAIYKIGKKNAPLNVWIGPKKEISIWSIDERAKYKKNVFQFATIVNQ